MTRIPLVLGAVTLTFVAAGLASCGGSKASMADIEAATTFDGFPLYWLGESFDKWDLAHVDGLDYDSQIVTFIYGDCTPHGGEQPSCTPPLQVQVSPLCSHLDVVARAPIWKQREIRGAPVGTIDSAPVLFTRRAQVKVYRGEGSRPGDTMRALRALRSINQVPPVIAASGPIPGPPRTMLEGTRSCTA
jgi:hypothetical protein